MTFKFNRVLEVVCAKFYWFMSYQQCTRFRTTLDFDREYFWNGSSKQQVKNGVINYDFSLIRRKQLGKLTKL